jgi:predicted amidohydrolase
MAKWDGSYTWHKPPSATAAPDRLRIATCQFPVLHDVGANTGQIVRLIEAASLAGADVAHFPECAISGYGPKDWPDWSGFDWAALDAAVSEVRAAAARYGIWVVAGCAHRDNHHVNPFNSVYVIDRRGLVLERYDKQACSQNDLRAFSVGTGAGAARSRVRAAAS